MPAMSMPSTKAEILVDELCKALGKAIPGEAYVKLVNRVELMIERDPSINKASDLFQIMMAEPKVEEIPDPDPNDFSEVLGNLASVRRKTLKVLHDRIIKAYQKFDVDKAFHAVESRIIEDMHEVTDKILGIDRRWSELNIKEGRLMALIDTKINAFIEEKAQPLIKDAIDKVLKDQSIQKTLKRVIRERIDSKIRNIDGYHNDTGKAIDAMLEVEIKRVFDAYTTLSSEEDLAAN